MLRVSILLLLIVFCSSAYLVLCANEETHRTDETKRDVFAHSRNPMTGKSSDAQGSITGKSNVASCGLECLSYLCRLYGIQKNAEDIGRALPNGSNGAISMLDLSQCVSNLGLSCVGVRISFEEYARIDAPAIAHFGTNHYVVLEKMVGAKVRVVDRPYAPCLFDQGQLAEKWDGRALVIQSIRPSGQGRPEWSISESHYDFGDIPVFGTAKHTFLIQNDGNTPVDIKNIATSCSCLRGTVSRQTVPPGESTEVALTFQADSHLGRQVKKGIIRSSDPLLPAAMISIAANVITNRVYATPQ